MRILKLSYYDNFRCVGSDCPETCCMHWSIIFGRHEYLKLAQADCSPKLKEDIEKSFVRIEGGDDCSYALIKFDEKGLCPMLDGDGLCRIQKELGERALSYTCSVFPRLERLVGEELYTCSCQITCPNVVKTLMAYPHGLKLTETEYDGSNPRLNSGLFSVPPVPKDWTGCRYYRDIKKAEISILQNRSFTVSQRMLILGFFCQKVNELINKKEPEKICGVVSALLMENGGEMCKKIADSLLPDQTREASAARAVELFGKMCLFASGESSLSSGVKALFQRVTDCLELKIRCIDENSLYFDWNEERYFKNAALYRAIEKAADFLIENVLVNVVFSMNPSEGIWVNYFTAAVFYSALKTCVPALLEEDWSDDELAAAISKTAKMVLNDSIMKKGVITDYVENRAFTLPHAAFLAG